MIIKAPSLNVNFALRVLLIIALGVLSLVSSVFNCIWLGILFIIAMFFCIIG